MKIVILNTSLTMQSTIETFLKDFSLKESEIHAFNNGYEALDFIKMNNIDIIFSDIEMPYMNGYEFAELVFAVMPDLKNSFFAISGDESRDNYLKMKNNGVHHFLRKPINLEVFRNFILPEILKVRFVENNLPSGEMTQLLRKI